jgi:dTMP kinase
MTPRKKTVPASGKFIVVEGIDGAGTTTQSALLRDALKMAGAECSLTREPTAGHIGKLIRKFLEKKINPLRDAYQDEKAERDVLSLLFTADRLDHLQREIEPALALGRHVVSDRYYHSTFAYQMKNAAHLKWLVEMNSKARTPDLTFFIDLPPAAALERMESRGKRDLFETSEQLRRIRAAYKLAIKELSARGHLIIIIDGRRAIDAIHNEMLAATLQVVGPD